MIDRSWVPLHFVGISQPKRMIDVWAYGLKAEPAFCMFLSWGQRGGVGWGDNVHLHFLAYMMLRDCASHIWCYVIVWGGVGWGDNVHVHFLTYMMLRYCASHIWCYVIVWGGVGWGGVITFMCTASHLWCYAAVISSSTAWHIWCYTAVILSSTAWHIWCYTAVISSCTSRKYMMLRCCNIVLHFLTYMMLRCCNFVLHFPTYMMLRCCNIVLHFPTCMMLRCCNFRLALPANIWCYAAVISSCTSSHIWCYAAVISSCTSPHVWCYAAVISSSTASHIWCYAAVISSCTCKDPCLRLFIRRVLRIQPCSMARFGRTFALGSGDGRTVPIKTCPSSLHRLSRPLSVEKKRAPLGVLTFPLKSTRVLFKEIALSGKRKNTVICGKKSMTKTANVENVGSINNPPGCLNYTFIHAN